jgi:hypothetical protein
MPHVSNDAEPKPGDVSRRALDDFLHRIDAILAEVDGEGGGGARGGG